MPPVAIAAGIAGAASIGGAAIASSSAKKARKAQQTAAAQQAAEAQRREATLTGLYQPTMDRGNAAGSLIGSFLGTEGGDKAAQALATYRGSTGYQDQLNTGLGAVNSSAYARGMGASGATLKALQTRGANIADQNAGQWLGGLQYLNNAGRASIDSIAGVSNNAQNTINGATQNAADATSNAALVNGASWTNALQNIGNIAGSYFGGAQARQSSSYAPAQTAPTYSPYGIGGTGGGYIPRTLR